MNKQQTQFWVAIIGAIGLMVIAGIAVVGALFFDAPNDMALMLVGGVIASAAASGAWLFRLNGSK